MDAFELEYDFVHTLAVSTHTLPRQSVVSMTAKMVGVCCYDYVCGC